MKQDKKRVLVVLAGLSAALVIAHWPVTTRVGVNYVWSSRRIPLYEKAVNFLSRDRQTRRIAREITAGASSDEDTILRIFSWVSQHIRPTPNGFPVVDDHPLHILIRGYGADDQRTEAFVLLAGYAGLEAGWVEVQPAGALKTHVFALVERGDNTALIDVVHRVIFRDAHGHLRDLSEVLANPQLIAEAAPGLVVGGLPYTQYVLELRTQGPVFSRTAAQRPWVRLTQEFTRWLRNVAR